MAKKTATVKNTVNVVRAEQETPATDYWSGVVAGWWGFALAAFMFDFTGPELLLQALASTVFIILVAIAWVTLRERFA